MCVLAGSFFWVVGLSVAGAWSCQDRYVQFVPHFSFLFYYQIATLPLISRICHPTKLISIPALNLLGVARLAKLRCRTALLLSRWQLLAIKSDALREFGNGKEGKVSGRSIRLAGKLIPKMSSPSSDIAATKDESE